MKTLVAPAHDPLPHVNGFGGCHARTGNAGCCPGKETARWLNSLGDDDDRYGSTQHTCGEVRSNYLRGNAHVVAVEPELARLTMKRLDLRRELQLVERGIRRILDAKKEAA